MNQGSKMSAKQGKILYGFITGILFVMLIISMSFNCYGASIYGDEYFSMGFANNTEDFLFLSQGVIEQYGEDGWLEGEFLHDWLSVQPGEQFAIMQIHRNVRDDVHPPLYFMLLNAISSFFVDEVTLFPGYLINVISGIVICALMYLIMRRTFKDKWLALVPPLFWVISMAGNTTMIYLRMYAPLCALTLLCLFLHMVYMEQDNIKVWSVILLFGCTTIGTLTHYYYYIIQFVLFIVVVITLLCRKQIRKLFVYGMSLLGGEIISVAAYPYVFRHLLFSERGIQVQENLVNNDLSYYISFFKDYMNTINYYVYNNQFKRIVVVLAICILGVWLKKFLEKKNYFTKNKEENRYNIAESFNKYNILLMTITAMGYFLILFKLSYSSRWLYISPIFAILGMITIGFFAFVIKKISPQYYGIIICAFSIVFLCPSIVTAVRGGIAANEQIRENHIEIIQYSENCDVMFFYDEWNNLFDNQILELMEFDQIRTISIESMEELDYQVILYARKDNDNLMVYFPTDVEGYQMKLANLKDKLNVEDMQLIREDAHAICFIQMN